MWENKITVKRGNKKMSDFSEKCKELIQESNTNVYRISQISGLERTALQRTVNGTRMPSLEFVKALCTALSITKIEEEELLELYSVEKEGKEVHQIRKSIIKLIQSVQKNHSRSYDIEPKFYTKVSRQVETPGHYKLGAESELYFAVQEIIKAEILNKEKSTIYMNTSQISEFALDILLQLGQNTEKELSVYQFIDQVKMKQGVDAKNINTICGIVPFAFTFRKEYFVYYSYVNRTSKDNHFSIWPCYIATPNYVLLFSDDLKSGVLYHDSEFAEIYTEEILRIKENYKLLFAPDNVCKDSARVYDSFMRKNLGKPCLVLESHPCVSAFFKNNWDIMKLTPLVGQKMQDTLKNIMIDTYVSNKVTSYFGMNEMEHFMETGKLPAAYKQVIEPIEKGQRRQVMSALIQSIETGSYNGFLVRGEKLPISNGLNIEAFKDGGMAIISMSEDFPFGILYIEEKGTVQAFYEFLEHISKTEFVYSREETVEHLKNFMEKYESVALNVEV